MNSDKFRPLEYEGNWASLWRWNKQDVKDGQQFQILWPDGTTETVKVTVRQYQEKTGRPNEDIPCNEVLIPIVHLGAKLDVRYTKTCKVLFRDVERGARWIPGKKTK